MTAAAGAMTRLISLVEYLRSLGMKENERVYGAVIIGYPANGLPNRSLMTQKGNETTYIDRARKTKREPTIKSRKRE